jgi:uncharacterized membrane protein affecting hemolysin expression
VIAHLLSFLAGVLLTSLYFRARHRALTHRLDVWRNALEKAVNQNKEKS